MVVQGGEVAPRRIPAVELHDPRLEREPEQQPPQEQQREGRQRAPRGGEDREKPGLEQQHVPLEGHERPADRREREVQRPAEVEVDGRPDVEQNQHSGLLASYKATDAISFAAGVATPWCSRTAWRNCSAGRMPCGPISPLTWTQNEANAMR